MPSGTCVARLGAIDEALLVATATTTPAATAAEVATTAAAAAESTTAAAATAAAPGALLRLVHLEGRPSSIAPFMASMAFRA